MTNTEWVKPYIDSIFSDKAVATAEALQKEKLNHINLPLYKYCYVCEESKRQANMVDYNIENFGNDELFFQNPENFNDPFDCFLGFSQVQLIRNVLIATLRREKKYTPQMRKAVSSFFSQDLNTSLDFDQLFEADLEHLFSDFIPVILSQTTEDEELQKCISEVMTTLLKPEYRYLFIRLIKNQLTVADKQKIVDLLFANETYKSYSGSKVTNKDLADSILMASQHDMKLKIETTPDSFLGNVEGSSFQLIDFFKLLLNAAFGKEVLPEFNDIKTQLQEASDSVMKKARKIISEQCRVTCLSEKMDSPLMWSHYANKHYGFCLEYDFTHTMIKRYPDLWTAQMMLFPVIYSDSRPLLSQSISDPKILLQYMKTKRMPVDIVKNILYGLLFKSQDWEYEKEWRIITINQERPTLKLPPPRKVFLGVNMEDKAKTKVIEIAKKKHIPVYQMILLSDRYKFDFFEVT